VMANAAKAGNRGTPRLAHLLDAQPRSSDP
jgi:hypothetical protein